MTLKELINSVDSEEYSDSPLFQKLRGTKPEYGSNRRIEVKKADGSRYYYFTSITVSKDGREVVVSSQEKSRNRLLRLMKEGKMLWRTPKDATTASVEQQGLDYAQSLVAETATKGSGITPQSTSMPSSDDKVSEIPGIVQGKGEKLLGINDEELLFNDGEDEGVDVKRVNQGRNLPMMEVNSIKTVFAHHGEIGGGEKLITYDKKITPEQEALLRGLNFREYPTIQEFSAAKIANDSETASIGAETFAENGICSERLRMPRQ